MAAMPLPYPNEHMSVGEFSNLSPVTVTMAPPSPEPKVGLTDTTVTGCPYWNATRSIVTYPSALATSTNTEPTLWAGAVHSTSDADIQVVMDDVSVPNRHVVPVASNPLPRTLTIVPPVLLPPVGRTIATLAPVTNENRIPVVGSSEPPEANDSVTEPSPCAGAVHTTLSPDQVAGAGVVPKRHSRASERQRVPPDTDTVTTVPPKTDPWLGFTDCIISTSEYSKRTPSPENSTPFTLTSTVTLLSLVAAGAVHTAVVEDCTSPRDLPLSPKEHTKLAVFTKLVPITVTMVEALAGPLLGCTDITVGLGAYAN
mmetsp:Transcript_11871/g.27310  ORF Transcript_11871/g.27310 Transcript_11871/m.27310 type:complete len:313 (+) Transcript_11871:3576-4514(+)